VINAGRVHKGEPKEGAPNDVAFDKVLCEKAKRSKPLGTATTREPVCEIEEKVKKDAHWQDSKVVQKRVQAYEHSHKHETFKLMRRLYEIEYPFLSLQDVVVNFLPCQAVLGVFE
jgi:flagellar biosynthesis regulator FlbT